MFVQRLVGNVENALRGQPVERVRKLSGRLWVTAQDGASFDESTLDRLRFVPGISSYSPVLRTPLDLDAMKEAAWAVAEPRTYESFRISARRAFKDLPLGSLEVNVAL